MVKQQNYEVIFYEDRQGRCPAQDFLDSLPVKVRAKAAKWIEKLQDHGPDLPRPYADIVRGKIRELRLVFASNQYRFLYFFAQRRIIITHGFIKKADSVPENELQRSENIMRDFEIRLSRGGVQL